MACRQRNHLLPMGVQERTGPGEQRICSTLRERCKGGLDLALTAGFDDDELLPDRMRRSLHIFSLPVGFGSVRVYENRDRGCPRHKLGAAIPGASSLTRQKESPRRSHWHPVG